MLLPLVLAVSCTSRQSRVVDAPVVVHRDVPTAPIAPATVASGSPPAELLGTFLDDYGSTHDVSASAWRHGTHSTYEVLSWHIDSQYFIARNASTNRSGGGRYTRIDWMRLVDMSPYTFAFCLSAYEASSAAAAESTHVANRLTPKSGCNGYPFSRLKRMAQREG